MLLLQITIMKIILLVFLTILITLSLMCGTCRTFNTNRNVLNTRKIRQVGVINFSDIFGKSLTRQTASFPTESPGDYGQIKNAPLQSTQKPVEI